MGFPFGNSVSEPGSMAKIHCWADLSISLESGYLQALLYLLVSLSSHPRKNEKLIDFVFFLSYIVSGVRFK